MDPAVRITVRMPLGTVIHTVLNPSGMKVHKISASAATVLNKEDILF
jgi:hypothetical protein